MLHNKVQSGAIIIKGGGLLAHLVLACTVRVLPSRFVPHEYPHISRCAEPTPGPSCSFIMNRQQYNQKYKSNLGKPGKSVSEGVMSATDGNIGEVFHHAGAVTHTAQKMMNNLSSQRRFEHQRDLLLVKVGEAKTRLLQEKTKIHFLTSHPIAASIPELENLEERLKNVLI